LFGLPDLLGASRIVGEGVFDLLEQGMTLDARNDLLCGMGRWVVDVFPEFSGLPEHRGCFRGVRECLTSCFGEFVIDQFELPARQLMPRGWIRVFGDVAG
jgi:hypothetical protein